MEEAPYDLTSMAMSYAENTGPAINPADYEGLLVRFVMQPHHDQGKSREQGRPIFTEIPYVDIKTPGDRTSHIFRPAVEVDKRRWPKHWKAFEDKSATPNEGTPLVQWPAINRALVEELKFFHVHTVEQLAELNDSACQNFMGIREWKERAKVFLEMSKESAEADKLAHELSKRDHEIEALKEQVGELLAKIPKEESEEE